MRNTAEASHAPAAASREPTAARRGRATTDTDTEEGTAPEAGATSEPGAFEPGAFESTAREAGTPEPPTVAVTAIRMLRVDGGLYALRVGDLGNATGEVVGMTLPVAHVCAPFAADGNGVEVVASFPTQGPWLRKAGGTLILRSPAGGGYVMVTVYGGSPAPAHELSVDLRRLDGAGSVLEGAAQAGAGPAAAPLGGVRDVPTEILLHIERAGDRLFPGRGWVGALGRRMRIEAFSIRPVERIAPTDIEMKGFLPNGGETPWVPGGNLCGTRGRGLPLIGFAVRVTPQRADTFDVSYQGSFFAGGISETQRNGAPCRANIPDDPLEAVNVRLIERVAEPDPDAAEAESEAAESEAGGPGTTEPAA